MESYILERAERKFPTIYGVFWIWAKSKGYDVAMGDMRKAWAEYRETEMSEDDKLLFTGSFEQEIKDKFNAYCTTKILNERENRKEEQLCSTKNLKKQQTSATRK